MLLTRLSGRRLLFFGGKGGVGKTTLASAVAAGLADSGKRVLLASTDPAHNLGHIWGREVGPLPVRLAAGLDALEIDPSQTVDAHLSAVADTLRPMLPERLRAPLQHHLTLARDAPGMAEAALLEKMADIVSAGLSSHDVVIFDTAPSGHTSRLLELPEQMAAWTEGMMGRRDRADRFKAALGQFRAYSPDTASEAREHTIRHVLSKRRDKFNTMRAALTDEGLTAFLIVLAAERLPVLESLELDTRLRRAGIPVAGFILNRLAPADAGAFQDARRAGERPYVAQMQDAVGPRLLARLPMLASEIVGPDALLQFFRSEIAVPS
ncbi:ArsA family ATPase [Aureimonas altamirensis]|uniref:ArsA family ATPase n=1 Tax=Aureimonas TaxID=414371 RepID=UPI00177DEE2B|nr:MULTISPECIES: ArsA family ATPase [Aureimonas]MCM2504248.1 ArsA family ATPase [Aureimonas altamirensis]QOG05164.1 ArsA family ATPase [Aureimonas sp. OT7]